MSATPSAHERQPTLSARILGWLTGERAVAVADLPSEHAVSPAAVAPTRSHPVETLRARWAEESAASGWLTVTDWWDPACDAVVEALSARRDPGPALTRLGHARAELGCGIEETIDDVVALWRIYIGGEPPVSLIRQVAAGWADAGMRPLGADSCIDPTTRLFTKAYLEARLGELYRNGRGGLPAEEYALVVVDIGEVGRLASVAAMGRVAEALRRVCSGGEPLAVLAPGRAVALCAQGQHLATQLSELDILLSEPGPVESLCAAIWVESLPRSFSLVQGLLQDLSR